MKLSGIKLRSLCYLTQYDVIKFKTVTICIHGGHFNQEKSVIFRQFACVADCLQSFMLAQKCRIRISEFYTKGELSGPPTLYHQPFVV